MTQQRPLVGIASGRLNNVPSPGAAFVGHRRSYSSMFSAAGALTFYLSFPDEPSDELARDTISRIDALVLTGGEHVFPSKKDVLTPHDHCPVRDEWELMLLNAALELGKSVFGVCRGMQMLVHRTGGTMKQLSTAGHPGSHMTQGDARERWLTVTHRMQLHPESALRAIVGEGKALLINSLHDQACFDLGANHLGLIPSAMTPDGVIEVVERSSDAQLIIGAQGHPEALAHGLLQGNTPPGLSRDRRLEATQAGLQWMEVASAFVSFVKARRY